MRRIWAPWRLEYVASEAEEGCFLCRALEREDDRENLLVYRGTTCAVILNRYPYSNGHLLVFPHRHVPEPRELTAEEKLESMTLLDRAIAILRETIAPHGFNVGINIGKAAGAGLETHLHTHIVPRWNGDTNYMAVIGDTRVIPQSLLDLWDRLHPLFNA